MELSLTPRSLGIMSSRKTVSLFLLQTDCGIIFLSRRYDHLPAILSRLRVQLLNHLRENEDPKGAIKALVESLESLAEVRC